MILSRTRQRVYEILEDEEVRDRSTRFFNAGILTLIFLNVLAVMLETVQSIGSAWQAQFRAFEIGSVAIFTAEYALRLWACTFRPGYGRPVSGRLRYALRWMPLVDLIAILPFYLPMLFASDLRFVRALRLFRLLRLFKVGRYSKALNLIARVFRAKNEELAVSAFAAAILFCIVSALMYHVESAAQPEAFSSIFATMWWTVSALTPLGSGVVPLTSAGKLLAALTAFGGVALFALPAGILASGFSKALADQKDATTTCPQCGAEIDSTKA